MVVLAQDEARARKHATITTGHVLLGLLREEEGLAARVLRECGVGVESARASLLIGSPVGTRQREGQIPFTPAAKKALELALREALSLGHNYIGTEHILLGLVRDVDWDAEHPGDCQRILMGFDLDPEKIRNEVVRMLTGPSLRTTREAQRRARQPQRTGEATEAPRPAPLADIVAMIASQVETLAMSIMMLQNALVLGEHGVADSHTYPLHEGAPRG